MWAYTQNAPDTRVPAIKLTHFIRTRHTETAPAAEMCGYVAFDRVPACQRAHVHARL